MRATGIIAISKEGERMERVKAYPRIEEELQKRLLNSSHIAMALGISYWSANRKRNGSTRWTDKEKEILSKYFGVSKSELFKR